MQLSPTAVDLYVTCSSSDPDELERTLRELRPAEAVDAIRSLVGVLEARSLELNELRIRHLGCPGPV